MSEKKTAKAKKVKTIWFINTDGTNRWARNTSAKIEGLSGTIVNNEEFRRSASAYFASSSAYIGVYMSLKSKQDEVMAILNATLLEQDKELNKSLSVLDNLFDF